MNALDIIRIFGFPTAMLLAVAVIVVCQPGAGR